MTNYLRVIPRDLFNEADLLKCLGRLWIGTEKYSHIVWEHDNRAFQISQDQSDGSISVLNVKFYVHGVEYLLSRPLNSRRPFSLQALIEDELINVFNEDGTFTESFFKKL